MNLNDNNWNEYRRLIISDLEKLTESTEKLTAEVALLNTKLTVLEVKAGFWGAASGAIVLLAAKIIGMKL